MKRPRSATVARASAAIISAAFRATASASISISTFIAVPTLRLEYWCDVFRTQYSSTPILHHSNLSAAHRRVFPASGRCNSLVDFTRSPGTGLVFVNRSARPQYRIDHAPGLFHIILASKQRSVSRYRVTEYAFVRIRLLSTGIMAREQLHLFADHFFLLIPITDLVNGRNLRKSQRMQIIADRTKRIYLL